MTDQANAPSNGAGEETAIAPGTIDQTEPQPLSTDLNDVVDRALDNIEEAPETRPNRNPRNGQYAKGKTETPAATAAAPADPVDTAAAAQTAPNAIAELNDGVPPSRFSKEAQAEWKAIPANTRKEIHRAIKEMTDGIEKHKVASDNWSKVSKYHDMAAAGGTTLDSALERYVGLENLFRTDLMQGIGALANNLGTDPVTMAHMILQAQGGHAPQQAHIDPNAIAQMIDGEFKRRDTLTQIEKFQSDHPRFEELAPHIEKIIRAGLATDLVPAYEMAERLIPAPASMSAAAPAVASQAAAQTVTAPVQPDATNKSAVQTKDKSALSVTGAPSAGSAPRKGKAPSHDDAIEAAFEAAGIR